MLFRSLKACLYQEYLTTCICSDTELSFSITANSTKRLFSASFSEVALSIQFGNIGANPKKVIFSLCKQIFPEAEKKSAIESLVDANKSWKFELTLGEEELILNFSLTRPFDDDVSWSVVLREQTVQFEQRVMLLLEDKDREIQKLQKPLVKSASALWQQFQPAVQVELELGPGSWLVQIFFLCKDTNAQVSNTWVYYYLKDKAGNELLPTNGHYVPSHCSHSYPVPVNLTVACQLGAPDKLTFSITQYKTTQIGSVTLSAVPVAMT